MGADFDTGQRFGAYTLGKLIGRGGMGVVYQAEHVHLGRVVALKLLTPELSDNEDFRARFLRESRLAAALDHPSVVTVYDAGDVSGVLYIAMRFVRGTDLSELLTQRGPLAAGETIGILKQVASALDSAHREDLVHRDVKPANVLIEGERCYLTDFGLTKRMSSDTRGITMTGQFLGTVDYVAPEQIEGGDCDGRVDVYALGCVLHECLTGSRPYPRETQVAVLYAQLRDPPPRTTDLRPDLPAAIDGVVARAMAKERDARFATCGELVTAAERALAGEAEPAQPATAPIPQPDTTPLAPPPAPQPRTPTAHTAPLPAELTTPAPSAPQERSSTGRGWKLGLLGAAAAAAAVSVAVVLLSGNSSNDDKGSDAATTSASAPAPAPAPAPKVGEPIDVGQRPVGVVASGGFMWVASFVDDSVTRVDPADNSTKKIPVGDGPFDLARGNDSVWSGNSLDGTVTRIDASSGEADDPVAVGTDPFFLTVKEDTLYVADGGDDAVHVVDASTGEAAADSIPVGSEPRGIAPSPDAVWVANHGDGTVTQIVDDQPADTVRVGTSPTGMAFGEDAIWVANTDDDTVSRIDVSDNRVTSADVGDAPSGMGFGEGFAWVTNSGDDTVMRLDATTGEPVGDPIPVPGKPVGVTVADGSVWVTSTDSGTLTRIDP